jgi:tetratricopeptide (TPR) repeat protein
MSGRPTVGLMLVGITIAFCSLQPSRASAGQAQAEVRFDELVRADFFAGLAGDDMALERALKLCESTLATDPRHPQALVWHGAGLMFQAGRMFQTGQYRLAMEQWERGLLEMNNAVASNPEDVSVLIPRGATLLEASRSTPDAAHAKQLLSTGVADYAKALALQANYFDSLSVHARGELLFGLAEGLHRLGEHDQARTQFLRIIASLPGSAYESKARLYLDGKADQTRSGCVGCHQRR